MDGMNSRVDEYVQQAKKWQAETVQLRRILLDCQLTETVKWGKPCYTFEGKNIVLIQGFKDYCALLFFKGALLNDAAGLLVKPGKQTQAGRQLRFTTAAEIAEREDVLTAYVREAVAVEKAGLQVAFKQTSDYAIPAEFQHRLDENPALQTAFAALTPGRQRAYLLHFSAPKQAKTRVSRVEKCVPQILDGKGLNDR